MELRVLKYFLVVARELNITRASHILHITQPTLSRQLKELEEELGTTLFIRGNKNISLTEEGLFFRKRAEEIVHLAEQTVNDLRIDDDIRGDVRIGSGETEGIKVVIDIMKDMKEVYPKISFHVTSGDKIDLLEKLDKGLIDFGVFLEPVDKVRYNYIKLPAKDRIGVLVRKDSSLAKKKFITKEDLLHAPLIVSRQLLEEVSLSQWFGVNLDKLNIVATYNLVYNASLLVEEGLGYAVTLDKLINTSGDSSLCFIPIKPSITVDMYLMWKKYQIFSKASDIFLKKIEEKIANNSSFKN